VNACVFCDIIAGLSPATFVQEWRDTVAFIPQKPVVRGHVLIVPNAHVDDVRWDAWISGTTFARAAEYARARNVHCNLITSAGSDATQTVEHLHVHYVPRHAGDGLHLPWTGQVTT
jgi:histidine triad (HIT) family protein